MGGLPAAITSSTALLQFSYTSATCKRSPPAQQLYRFPREQTWRLPQIFRKRERERSEERLASFLSLHCVYRRSSHPVPAGVPCRPWWLLSRGPIWRLLPFGASFGLS